MLDVTARVIPLDENRPGSIVGFRCNDALRAGLERAAKEDGEQLSVWIRIALRKELSARKAA